MKSVVLFINALTQGGAERQLLLLGEQLSKKGYDVTLVTYVDAEDHYVPYNGIKRIRIAEGKSNFIKLLQILKYFKSVKTDIVISFAERNSFLAIAGLYNRDDVKVIASERNFMVNNGYLMSLLRKIFYKRAYAIVPNSNAQGEFLQSLNENIRKKVTVITNYTDISLFHPYEKRELQKDSKYKLCVLARYDIQKNFKRLSEAIAKLKNQKKLNVTIDWYGKNIDSKGNLTESYKEFKSLIKFLNIEDDITLYPAARNIETILANYDGFLLPSLYEGFSNALSEAISCGIPCIVSNVSDNKIMVHDGINGFLFNPNDVDSICDALIKFQNLDTKELAEFGLSSRKIAESLFDIESFVQKYISLF